MPRKFSTEKIGFNILRCRLCCVPVQNSNASSGIESGPLPETDINPGPKVISLVLKSVNQQLHTV